MLVTACVELLEPHVAAHVDVGYFVRCAFLVVAHPLLHHAALHDEGIGGASGRMLILELGEP